MVQEVPTLYFSKRIKYLYVHFRALKYLKNTVIFQFSRFVLLLSSSYNLTEYVGFSLLARVGRVVGLSARPKNTFTPCVTSFHKKFYFL